MRGLRSKTLLVVTALGMFSALGATFAQTANAGSMTYEHYLGERPGNHGSYNSPPSISPGYVPGIRQNHYYNHPPKRKKRHSNRQQSCHPQRALNKAYNLGLDNPQIHRIKERRIVVSGFQNGYRAKMVFKRYSNCHLIKTVRYQW